MTGNGIHVQQRLEDIQRQLEQHEGTEDVRDELRDLRLDLSAIELSTALRERTTVPSSP